MRLGPHRLILWILVGLVAGAGCGAPDRPATNSGGDTSLNIGFGSTTGARIQQVVHLITQEGLVNVAADGRPFPWLAKSWTVSADGLTWRFSVKEGVQFHDGSPLTAPALQEVLSRELPGNLGPAAEDLHSIEAPSPTELVVRLKRRSTFLIEALTLLIHPKDSSAGTGPFYEAANDGDVIELRANERYPGGRPFIDRIVIRPYASVRSAWADLMRARVDMMYEVGVDAIDLIGSSRETKVFTFRRPYSYVLLLNTGKAKLRSAALRRKLNEAIDRGQFVTQALGGHGRPANGPVWPDHWTNEGELPGFSYSPSDLAGEHLTLTCIYSDPALERMALFVQQQLRATGVEVRLELTSVDEGLRRAQSGAFDAWLADAGIGPGFLRQYLFWRSASPFNWGNYSNQNVDITLDQIRRAETDSVYKSAVADFQKAMIEDPPAIFLAWSERARAVSTRFDVPDEHGRDILSNLQAWKPTARSRSATN